MSRNDSSLGKASGDSSKAFEAFVLMLVFIMVLPRMNDSLHPGQGGNPGFNAYDMDDSLRAVFYPITLGFILLGVWAFNLKHRLAAIEYKRNNEITE